MYIVRFIGGEIGTLATADTPILLASSLYSARGVPTTLANVRRFGRTLRQSASDTLAFFDSPDTSNGPTEATNGRLEHLRGTALGFRNLTDYISRSLLEVGSFRPRPDPQS